MKPLKTTSITLHFLLIPWIIGMLLLTCDLDTFKEVEVSPQPNYPGDGIAISERNVTFEWEHKKEGVEATHEYEIWVSYEDNEQKVLAGTLETTPEQLEYSYTVTDPLDFSPTCNTIIDWWIVAVNDFQRLESHHQQFYLFNPQAPILLSPADESDICQGPIEFTWETLGCYHHYFIEIASDSDFQDMIHSHTLSNETDEVLDAYETEFQDKPYGTLYWRVYGKWNDWQGDYSNVFSFSNFNQDTELENYAAPQSLMIEPNCDGTQSVITWEAPESGTPSKYSLRIGDTVNEDITADTFSITRDLSTFEGIELSLRVFYGYCFKETEPQIISLTPVPNEPGNLVIEPACTLGDVIATWDKPTQGTVSYYTGTNNSGPMQLFTENGDAVSGYVPSIQDGDVIRLQSHYKDSRLDCYGGESNPATVVVYGIPELIEYPGNTCLNQDALVSWDAHAGVTEFVVQWSDDHTFTSTTGEATVSNTDYTIPGANLNTVGDYYWRVRVNQPLECEEWSDTTNYSFPVSKPESPTTGFNTNCATAGDCVAGSDDVTFTFTETSESTYEIEYISTADTFTDTPNITGITSTGHSQTIAAGTYKWQIRGCNATCCGDWVAATSDFTIDSGLGCPTTAPTSTDTSCEPLLCMLSFPPYKINFYRVGTPANADRYRVYKNGTLDFEVACGDMTYCNTDCSSGYCTYTGSATAGDVFEIRGYNSTLDCEGPPATINAGSDCKC